MEVTNHGVEHGTARGPDPTRTGRANTSPGAAARCRGPMQRGPTHALALARLTSMAVAGSPSSISR